MQSVNNGLNEHANSDTRCLEWHEWISRYHDKSIDFSLTRMDAIARALKLTSFDCPVITVAGTNGKGSTIATMEAILLATGKRVGVYTSPHFFQFNERIRINGEDVAEFSCAAAFSEIKSAVDAYYSGQNNEHIPSTSQLTFFEYATLIALYIFKHSNLDIVILEVGLGGRLDAVNVVANDVSIITSIGMDHTEYLGNTLDKIVREKAGIIKDNSYVVCGDLSGEQQQKIVRDIALAKSSQVYFLGKDFTAESIADLPNASIPQQNMACALQALQCLQLLPNDLAKVAAILAEIKVTGRFQRHLHAPGVEIIFDVAHNPPAAEWLARKVKMLPKAKTTIAIIGIAANKDSDGVLAPFIDVIDVWYPVSLQPSKVEMLSPGTYELDPSLLNIKQSVQHVQQSFQQPVLACKNFLTADILEKKIINLGGKNILTKDDVLAAWQACLNTISAQKYTHDIGVQETMSKADNIAEENDVRSVRILIFGSFVTVAAGLAAIKLQR